MSNSSRKTECWTLLIFYYYWILFWYLQYRVFHTEVAYHMEGALVCCCVCISIRGSFIQVVFLVWWVSTEFFTHILTTTKQQQHEKTVARTFSMSNTPSRFPIKKRVDMWIFRWLDRFFEGDCENYLRAQEKKYEEEEGNQQYWQ